MKKPSIGRVLLLASVILVITQSVSSISAQTVLFNADFSNTTGDNAWTQSINTNGSFDAVDFVLNNQFPNYANNALFALESPIIDLTGYWNLTLDLRHFYKTEPFRDGIQMQYRIDGGTWSVLGTEANGYYNDTDVNGIADNTDGWSGDNTPFSGNAFTAAPTLDLTTFNTNFNNASNVQLRVVFGSDNTSDLLINNDGAAIDDVIIRGRLIGEYCTPQAISNPSTIRRVAINTIDNNTPIQNNGYSDFTTISTDLEQNSSYPLTVQVNTNGNFTFNTRAWIDWNQDGDFNDAGEEYNTGTASNVANGATSNSPLNITVPAGANLGPTVMRVQSKWNGTAGNPSPCLANNSYYGETEDYQINVTSSVPQPEIAIFGSGIEIIDGSTTPNAGDGTNFGTITAGSILNRTFTIRNTGTATLNLSGSVLGGTSASSYTITSPPPATIAAGSSATFTITYNPTVGGVHNATFSVANNDSNENPYNFSITGTATGPQPEISLNGLGNIINDGDTTTLVSNGTNFGASLINGSISRTYTIANSGSANLNLTGASPYAIITGSPYFTVTAIPSSTIIPGGGSTSFEVTYNPILVGNHSATVTINNNDSDENPYTFVIEGQCTLVVAPEIDIFGNAVEIVDGDTTPNTADDTDFSNVFLGSSDANDFTITNTGTADLVLNGTQVQIQGGGGNFAISSMPSTTIAAGESSVFQVTYTPNAVGTHNATVRVTSNDINEGDYTFDIEGSSTIDISPRYTIHYNNFDVSAEGWTVSNLGGASVWTYGANTTEPGTDGNYFYTNNYNDFAPGSDTYAISPVIDLTGFTDLRLYIDVRFNLDNDLEDGMNIEYSSNGGTNWTVLGTSGLGADNKWYNDANVLGLGTNVNGWSGINDSNFNAAKSQFMTSYLDLPASLVNNPQARFRVRFSDDNDATRDDGANFDNFIIVGNPQIPFGNPASGPADVASNLKLWLKSNSGITATDGNQVNVWSDQAQDNDATVSSFDAPTYFNNSAENINHNPVLSFNEADKTQLKGKGGFYSQDYWVVLKQNGTIDGTTPNAFEGVVAGRASNRQFSEDGTGFWTGKISIRFSGNDNMLSHMIGSTPASANSTTPNTYGRAYSSNSDSYTDEVIIINIKRNASGNGSEIYKNGIRVDNVDAFAYNQNTNTVGNVLPYDDINNSIYALGVSFAGLNRTDISSWFNGKITEFISYSLPNSLLNQKKIQSYLALKNGVTLHRTNSTTTTRQGDENYIDSDGTTIWDTTINNGFTYDIAGIGRDDAATLNQKQSTSSNPGAIVTMGLSDIYNTNSENISANTNVINDKNFLVWGNNNGSFAASAPIQVDLSDGIAGLNTLVDFSSILRTWKVVETGAVGDVKISVPEASLSATITPPGNFLMFISDTPSFSPTSEYRVMTSNGTNIETIYDFDGTKYITFGYAPEYIYERSITFDGTRDYMDADDVADLTGPFTISTWIKPGANANGTDIISKRNFGSFTEGYALILNNASRPRIVWRNAAGTTEALSASIALPQDEWHHIAVIYDGNRATFYIDGIEDNSGVRNSPVSSSQHFMVAAANYQNPTRFFDGTIDEVRVWNQALSQEQLQFIMNQEIEKFTDDSVNGKIIPQNISKNEVASIPWADLEMYLPMNKYTFTNVKDESDNNYVAAIKNLQTVDFQTAPLPYVSTADGVWANTNTWTNGATQALPGAPSLVDATQTIDWNIVQTAHNISTASNNTVLALDVSTAELTVGNDSKMEVSHYLKLDGVMDLVGESQLIQTENSDLAAASIGRLERDQQGTSDTFSYNIWSSPVEKTNPDGTFTIASIMNDGTDENNPQSLNFSTGFNGANTIPKTVSAYWLFTYRNDPADTYSAYEQIGPYGSLDIGDGFTMKGPGSGGITDPQNYVFIGRPNNGTDAASIDKLINAGNDFMMGNPFPSALDANKFINDNPHLTGTLSFWEHWGGGNHFLADYEAGYALYTLSGGTPAVSHPAQNTSGVGTKTPTQFIAVGQGFFVRAATTGTTNFNNTQRVFAKEASSGSFFFNGETTQSENALNAEDDIVQHEDLREKFRIGFDSPSAYHRQLLMTIDENTTFGYDRAYDAVIDNHPQEDMMWMLDDNKAIILGVPAIENDRKFPLRIGLPMDGEISIGVDALENVNTENTTVYVFDALQDTYTDITTDDKFTLTLEAGTYLDRFYIVFEQTAAAEEDTDDTTQQTDEQEENNQDIEVVDTDIIDETEESDNLSIYFNSQSHDIVINKRVDYDLKSIQLFTMLGQLIKEWTPDSETSRIELPVQDISTGAYIIKVQKLQTTYTQKLIIH
ncbi:choice-of-anchor D domain-containing protein [Dokdonia sp. 4H-3-7-5]|uniref:choice-of-anchor D domain-containing protein n=1 Tax=Dokdonia sp. (strain 4H-3-7-5) TaxID=983548 RepID=UPI00020A60AF|nr:choice-of-anchor D domain-containing protein [Dokdonia sp. 4H-3-7-5]AEE18315.1 Laminin G sub domain 2 [Dokdonia sp. 4H-3-7-5]